MRGPALGDGALVCVVEKREGEELCDERVFDGEHQCGPCDGRGDDAICVAAVGLHVAVFGKF